MEPIVERIEVAKLTLVAGEILVVKIPSAWANASYEHIASYVGATLPEGVRLLVLPKDAELAVLSPHEARAPNAMRLC